MVGAGNDLVLGVWPSGEERSPFAAVDPGRDGPSFGELGARAETRPFVDEDAGEESCSLVDLDTSGDGVALPLHQS